MQGLEQALLATELFSDQGTGERAGHEPMAEIYIVFGVQHFFASSRRGHVTDISVFKRVV